MEVHISVVTELEKKVYDVNLIRNSTGHFTSPQSNAKVNANDWFNEKRGGAHGINETGMLNKDHQLGASLCLFYMLFLRSKGLFIGIKCPHLFIIIFTAKHVS